MLGGLRRRFGAGELQKELCSCVSVMKELPFCIFATTIRTVVTYPDIHVLYIVRYSYMYMSCSCRVRDPGGGRRVTGDGSVVVVVEVYTVGT